MLYYYIKVILSHELLYCTQKFIILYINFFMIFIREINMKRKMQHKKYVDFSIRICKSTDNF